MSSPELPNTAVEVVIRDDIRESDRFEERILSLGARGDILHCLFDIMFVLRVDIGGPVVRHLILVEGLLLVGRAIIELDSLSKLLTYTHTHERAQL